MNRTPLPRRKHTQTKKYTLAIDFDGVIYNPDIKSFYPDTLSALDVLTRRYRVIIFSSRATTPGGEQMIRDILRYNMVNVVDVTSHKPMADLYIDDKAIHHTSWDDTVEQISQRLNLQIN